MAARHTRSDPRRRALAVVVLALGLALTATAGCGGGGSGGSGGASGSTASTAAAVFKIGIVTVGALVLWRLRRYRAALFAAVVLAGIFAAVVAYQVFWLTSL